VDPLIGRQNESAFIFVLDLYKRITSEKQIRLCKNWMLSNMQNSTTVCSSRC